MDNRSDVREFLSSRRARITPEEAGLPAFGGNRRVPGLRREEVALLAGVSVDYYTRLERGNLSGVSESVLDALARALQLDEAEREHLFDLARATTASSRARRQAAPQRVRPGLQRLLDSINGPAWVQNWRLDFLAANRLGFALHSELLADPGRPVNSARFVFLNPRSHEFFPDWQRSANDVVAILRTEVGRHPYDRGLSDLVGELSTRSDDFRTRWAVHNVRLHRTGLKRIHHPVVGDLELNYEAMVPGRPWTDDVRLYRRVRFSVRRWAQAPRELDRNTGLYGSIGDGTRAGRGLTVGVLAVPGTTASPARVLAAVRWLSYLTTT